MQTAIAEPPMHLGSLAQHIARRGIVRSPVDEQIGGFLDRIVEATSQTVIGAYEKRINELERRKLALQAKGQVTGERYGIFEELFQLAFVFLASTSKVWKIGRIEYQKLVLELAFADRLDYGRIEGFRTPKITLPFKVLGVAESRECGMAERQSFEIRPIAKIII